MQTNEKRSEAWAEIRDEESLFKFEEIITCQLDSVYTDLDRLIDNLNICASSRFCPQLSNHEYFRLLVFLALA